MLRAISALELIQACALIHDDLMDASATRRGRPTVHVEFARRHADAGWRGPARPGSARRPRSCSATWRWPGPTTCCARAGLPADGAGPGAPSRGRRCAPRCSAASSSTCCTRPPATRRPRAALQIDRFKTAAYTVERPLHLGAAIAGAAPELVAAYRRFGADIGVAFQLRDDLLGRVRRPGGHRQARRRRPARGQAHAAAGPRRCERAAERRAARGAAAPSTPRWATPTSTPAASTRSASCCRAGRGATRSSGGSPG